MLSDDQRDRIAQAWLRDPQFDALVPRLFVVLGDYRNDRFDRAVVEAIDREFELDSPNVYTLQHAIPAILIRLGDADAEYRLDKLGKRRLERLLEADGVDEPLDLTSWRRAWAEAKAAVRID
jgi:hypothetical protein